MLTLTLLIIRLLFLPPLLVIVLSALSAVILFAAPRWTTHPFNLSSLFNGTFPRQPLRPPYEESSGSAQVQQHLLQLEALMRQLQSAIAQLNNEDKSSDGKV